MREVAHPRRINDMFGHNLVSESQTAVRHVSGPAGAPRTLPLVTNRFKQAIS